MSYAISFGRTTTLSHFSHDSPVIRWHNGAPTTTFNNNKGYAPELVRNDIKLLWNGWNLMFKTLIWLDSQWISNGTRPNQKWNEINEYVREMLCYMSKNVVSFRTSFLPPSHPQRLCIGTYQKRQKTDPLLSIQNRTKYCFIALWGMDAPGLKYQ